MGTLALAALSFWDPVVPREESLTKVVGRPVLIIGRVQGYPSATKSGDTFLLKTRWIRFGHGDLISSRQVIRVFRRHPAVPWVWGDDVSVWGIAGEADRFSGSHVTALLFVPPQKDHLLKRLSWWHPLRWACSMRDRFHHAFETHLPPLHARLMGGVLLGDRPPGLESLADDFRRSGLSHLLVASGSNVGFALGVWWAVSRWVLWWPRKAALAFVPGVAFLYAGMAGGDAPVLRAAVMASFLSVATMLGRWDRLEHALFLSAGILLIFDPARLFQAGFQLSYVATYAIVVVWGARREQWIDGPVRVRGVWGRIFQRIQDLLVTSTAAQLALAPLLLYYFKQFSWVGIGANILAVPLAGVCLWLGALLAFLDNIWPWAATVCAVPTRWSAEALMGWARLWAAVPGAQINFPLNGPQALVLFGGIVLGFAVHRNRKWIWIVPVSFFTGAGVWGLSGPISRPSLEIHWREGRVPVVDVRMGSDSVVFTKKPESVKKAYGKQQIVCTGGPAQRERSMSIGGQQRLLGISPEGGDGFAVLVNGETERVFLNFGLTARQQRDPSVRGVGRVDGVSWMSGSGGPPSDELLEDLCPRWIVPLSRPSRSIRRCGAKIIRQDLDNLFWRSDERGAGFVASKNW